MTTSFPTGLDALTNPTGSSSLTSPDHAGQHTDANDAIEALQAKVGVNGSAVTTSLDYKIANGVLPKLNVDSGVLVVDATNNRVGVGTTSPQAALDVQSSQTFGMLVTHTGAGNAFRVEDASGDTTPFVIDGDGNVGIKTNSPTQALEVVGNAYIQGGITATGDMYVDSTTFRVDASNNRVGVGTATPNAKLDVQSNGVDTAMRITNTGTGYTLYVEDSASTDTTPFAIDASGNVSIGKSTASYPLDNNGITRSSDYIVGTGTKYMPRGIVAVTTSTSNTITSNILTGLNTTFTAIAGRYYRVSVLAVTSMPIAGSRVIITFNGASVRIIDYTCGAAGFNILQGSAVQTVAAGTQTVQVQWSVIAGTVNPNAGVGNGHQLVIEDLGTLS